MINNAGKRIPPQKMGRISEQGTCKPPLSKAEWRWLNEEGYEELKQLMLLNRSPMHPLPDRLEKRAANRFFPLQALSPAPLHIRCAQGLLELLERPLDWKTGSEAFAWRNDFENKRRLTLKHTHEKITAHIELVSHSDDSTDITVRCNDPSGKPVETMDIELMKNGRCIESVNASAGGTVNIRNIAAGSMQLRIYSSLGTCITLDLRVDS